MTRFVARAGWQFDRFTMSPNAATAQVSRPPSQAWPCVTVEKRKGGPIDPPLPIIDWRTVLICHSRHDGFSGRWLRFDSRLGDVDDVVFPLNLSGLFTSSSRGLGLSHLAASFEDCALLDHQRRRLNVSSQLCRPSQLDPIGSDNVTVNDAMDRGDTNFDICVHLTASADNQGPVGRRDAAGKTAIDA